MPSVYQLEPQISEATVLSDTLTADNSVTARNWALWFAAALLFVRFSLLNEVLTYLTGLHFYLLYIIGAPAILAVFAKKGLRDTLRQTPVLLWLSFGLWLVLATPFSIWRGGSVHTVIGYFRSELVMLFVVGALARTWRDCKLLMHVMAAAAMVSLAVSRIFASTTADDRLSLEFGAVANANDFAGHLLLILPFLLWIALSSTSRILRLIALLGVCYGAYVVLASGSRGALIALAAELLFFTFTSDLRHRIALCILAPLVIAVAFTALPKVVSTRLITFFPSATDASVEALESTQAREQLLLDSINCAVHHPIFGIGPGQFEFYEGTTIRHGAERRWHNAHNSYTLAASEAGIPALLFYVAAICSTWLLLRRVRGRARIEPQASGRGNAVLCVMIALLGFCTAIFFLNFTYTLYLPAMGGLAIALNRATNEFPNGRKEEEQNAPAALYLTWTGSTRP